MAEADRATQAVGLFKQDSILSVVDCIRPVFENCPFFFERNAGHGPEGITDVAVSNLITDEILVVSVIAIILLCVSKSVDVMHVCL